MHQPTKLFQFIFKFYASSIPFQQESGIAWNQRLYGSLYTGGPPLTRKALTRFPLTRFLAYVRVSGGISVSRGPQYSPTNTTFV